MGSAVSVGSQYPADLSEFQELYERNLNMKKVVARHDAAYLYEQLHCDNLCRHKDIIEIVTHRTKEQLQMIFEASLIA